MAKSVTFFKFRKARIKTTLKFLAALLVILLAAIFQDYLQARYQSNSFYFSQSLLFNLYWTLIVPVTFLLRLAFRRSKMLSEIRSKWAARSLFVLLATILHLFLVAFLVFSVSGLFYVYTFGFWENLVYLVSNDLYKFLLIYSVIALVLIRREKKPKSRLPHEAFQS